MITVRRARIEDTPMIMQYLDEHWLKGYALAENRALFDWQFVKDGKVNIWIGVDDEEGKMYAMQGVIPYSSNDNPDISGTLWIAIKSGNPFLAIEVLDAMLAGINAANAYSVGMLEDSVKALSLQGAKFSKLDHYYRLSDRDRYSIAVVKNKIIPEASDYGYTVEKISDFSDFKDIISEEYLLKSSPRKDYNYIKWRYWEHPVFTYNKWCIWSPDGKRVSVFFTREEKYNSAKSCKLVDYYGQDEYLGKITKEIDRIMVENGYEFMDVYSYGVSPELYENAGFIRCEKESENIIPNFFQPYTPINSDIIIITPQIEGTRLFRGDSDQDKPRLA